jgi:hypothetical protein
VQDFCRASMLTNRPGILMILETIGQGQTTEHQQVNVQSTPEEKSNH